MADKVGFYRAGRFLPDETTLFEVIVEDGTFKGVTVADVRDLIDYSGFLEEKLMELATTLSLMRAKCDGKPN